MVTVSVTREKASALISPEESNEIIQSVVENSTALRVMTRLPNTGFPDCQRLCCFFTVYLQNSHLT